MALAFPQSSVGSLHELAARLLESRKANTDLRTLARDLLAGFFELCLRAGLDGLLVELELDVADWSSLADHATLAPLLVAQLDTIDLDGGGPRSAKPRQLADCVVTALGLAITDEPDRTITLGPEVRAEVQKALASAIDGAFAAPQFRETVIAMGRERIDPQYLAAYNRMVAHLDERGMAITKQLKLPVDAVHAVQRVLVQARNALVDRVGRVAIDRAKAVIAQADPAAAARIDEPVTLRLTPREVAILRACDARVPKSPAGITTALLDGTSELARIAWRAAEQTARPYAASATFTIGELLDHPKFGRGSVVGALAARIDVEFADGMHTLVHVPPRK